MKILTYNPLGGVYLELGEVAILEKTPILVSKRPTGCRRCVVFEKGFNSNRTCFSSGILCGFRSRRDKTSILFLPISMREAIRIVITSMLEI